MMTLRGPVLVGTDLTTSSAAALREGYRLARDLQTEFIVCHVLPELSSVRMLFPQWAGPDPEVRDAITTKAREAIQRQVANVLEPDRRDVDVRLDSGSPHAGLLFQADSLGAGIIVLGPGRAATRVVRHALVPVLVARSSPRGAVIGATDFSDPSMPALEAAAVEAQRRESRLHLLHAVDVGAYALAGAPGAFGYLGGVPATSSAIFNELRSAAKLRLQEELNRSGVDGEAHADVGPAATTIIEHAKRMNAELVVVGTHGRSGFARLTLGSTAEHVLDAAPCSVLVVRLSP